MYDYRKLDYYNYENNNYNQPLFTKDEQPSSLYDPYTGFISGNMFRSLHNGYKINPLDIKPKNYKESLKLYMDAMCFAAHDINLYLDLYPNDKDMTQLFNQYRMDANKLKAEYQMKYGPILTSSDALNKVPWAWDNEPWPWEN